jgi:DNA-binding PadR family transcriptional regulator
MSLRDMSLDDVLNVRPLSEPVLLILVSLADEPRHGYAILQDVEALSQGRVKLSTGTLYGAIRRLLEDEWIEPVDEAAAPRGRRAYRLTSEGREVLEAETERMRSLARIATARLKPKLA